MRPAAIFADPQPRLMEVVWLLENSVAIVNKLRSSRAQRLIEAACYLQAAWLKENYPSCSHTHVYRRFGIFTRSLVYQILAD